MKAVELRLLSEGGEELETIELEAFAIASEPEDDPPADNEEILTRVAALYESVISLLLERQVAPKRGRTWLKLALGKPLLTADQQDGDVVIEVIVRPLREGEDDAWQ
jgi:hypothetical protein